MTYRFGLRLAFFSKRKYFTDWEMFILGAVSFHRILLKCQGHVCIEGDKLNKTLIYIRCGKCRQPIAATFLIRWRAPFPAKSDVTSDIKHPLIGTDIALISYFSRETKEIAGLVIARFITTEVLKISLFSKSIDFQGLCKISRWSEVYWYFPHSCDCYSFSFLFCYLFQWKKFVYLKRIWFQVCEIPADDIPSASWSNRSPRFPSVYF